MLKLIKKYLMPLGVLLIFTISSFASNMDEMDSIGLSKIQTNEIFEEFKLDVESRFNVIEFSEDELSDIRKNFEGYGTIVGATLLLGGDYKYLYEYDFVRKDWIDSMYAYSFYYPSKHKMIAHWLRLLSCELEVRNIQRFNSNTYFSNLPISYQLGNSGDTLAVDIDTTITNSWDSNVSISPSRVSNGIGFNINDGVNISLLAEWSVPSGVRHGSLEVFALYNRYNFEVWKDPFLMGNDMRKGDGRVFEANDSYLIIRTTYNESEYLNKLLSGTTNQKTDI